MEESEQKMCKKWTATRKLEVVIRYMKGDGLDLLSREVGLPAGEIEKWHQAALLGAEVGLRSRAGDPLHKELDQAKKQIGELSMQVELLKKRPKAVFQSGRS